MASGDIEVEYFKSIYDLTAKSVSVDVECCEDLLRSC